MKITWRATHVLFAVAATVVAIGLTPTRASDSYLSLIYEQFGFVEDDEIGCSYCHTDPDGGEGWNGFGELAKQNLEETDGNMSQSLYLTLKANHDSDHDGYADVLEVVAKTLPGDPKSRPKLSIGQLEQTLIERGGIEAFKPQ
jgi:hypothetical protein